MLAEKNDDLHEKEQEKTSESEAHIGASGSDSDHSAVGKVANELGAEHDALSTKDAQAEHEETSESEGHIAASVADRNTIDNEEDKVQAEIDASNAKNAEDEAPKKHPDIPMPDYHAMDLEMLVNELKKNVEQEKIPAIKKHVEKIKYEFDTKYREFLKQKKEEFVDQGGNAVDFKYESPLKSSFTTIYGQYREKRSQYYKNLEQQLHLNVKTRLEIIEALKALINVEENINTTYKTFKTLQERWRKTGPIPRTHYNNIWRTYQHHVEIFYDFLDLNRELRDLDFKKNLEEKQKIIAKAEQLIDSEDIHQAFQKLQELHRIWKEDIGPVDREHREAIWKRFSDVTKTIHQKRQDYFKTINEVYEQNLIKKQEIIQKIEEISAKPGSSNNEWRAQINAVEALRESFFAIGRVPYKAKEKNWTAFKNAYRSFNHGKNSFYKNLKKEYQENLKKKTELLKIAESLKDSEDWEKTTPIMKEIQADWGKIGHVPRKHSNEIWASFKAACNHYFNRLHERRNASEKRQSEDITKKKELLDTLIAYTPGDHPENDLENIQKMVTTWRTLSNSAYRKRDLEDKFNKTLDALFLKLNLDKQQAELIKYGNKLEHLAHNEDLLNNERSFLRRRISEVNAEIRQLENNLQFIHAKADNPVVKEVIKTIDKHKEALAVWKEKLKKLRSM